MERFPSAAYGLDSIVEDENVIYPHLLNPREAYYLHYIKRTDIFHKAPTSCTIRREIFEREKGFKELRMVGDFEMWHRLSLKYPVVIMPRGMVWSRGHDDSESGKLMNKPFINYHYRLVQRQYLVEENCPLDYVSRKTLVRFLAAAQLKILIRIFFKLEFKTYRQIRNLDNIPLLRLFGMAIAWSPKGMNRSAETQVR
jgi:hypothetical protein